MTTAKAPIVYTGTGSAIDNYKSKKPQGISDWGKFNKNNQQHRTILSLLRQANWTTKTDKGEFADMVRFGDWLQTKKSPVKKPLMSMEPEEVSKIIEALKGLVKSIYK